MPVRSWADLLNDAGDAGGSFEPLPVGDYDFIIDSAEATQSTSGKTMYKIKAKVVSGPMAKRIVWHQFVVSPDSNVALNIFFRHMNVLGLGPAFFATNPSDHQVAEHLTGRTFRGQIQIRQWQGQDRNEIKQFWSMPTGGVPVANVAGPGSSMPTPAPAPAFAAPAVPAPAPTPQVVAPPAPAPIQQTVAAPPVPDAAPPAPAVESVPTVASFTAPPPPPF